MKNKEDKPIPYPDLSPEQEKRISQLNDEDLSEIDKAIVSFTDNRWKKQAMIIGQTMMLFEHQFPNIPDIFYATRVTKLVAEGKLEVNGNLKFMRFSEIRLKVK
jgi:hypothetical protein